MEASSATGVSTRRVLPKATSLACLQAEAPGLLKELHLLGVGGGIAALDVVHAQLIQAPGDGELVLQGEAHALGLHAVAKRRIVDLYPGHRDSQDNKASESRRLDDRLNLS